MNKRCRMLTDYRDVVAVGSSAELRDVPANHDVVDDIIKQGGLIFRDPADRNYLLVVAPEGVNLFGSKLDGEDIEDYLQALAVAGTAADVYPAPEESLQAGERGWEVLFASTALARTAEDEDVADELVRVDADFSDLPELADHTIAAEITTLGGRIYRVAVDANYADDYTPDQTDDNEDNAGAATIARYASLETALSDPQQQELSPAHYLLVVIPAGTATEQAVDIALLIRELPRFGFASPPERSTAGNGDVHIAFDLSV